MGDVTDVAREIRPHPADLALVLQEQPDLLAEREDSGADREELAGLVGELRQLQGW